MDDVSDRTEDRPVADCAALYERKRRELVEIVRAAPADARARRVPATPDWTVQDVVAHLTGLAADMNAQRFPAPDDRDGTRWTAAQVEPRRGRPLDDLVAEWDREAPPFEDALRALGYEIACHFVGDLTNHAQDVRHALGLRADDDADAIRVSLDHYLADLDRRLRERAVGVLEIDDGARVVTVGAGASRARLEVSPFELLRGVAGRRSRRQLVAMAWGGDGDAFVDELSAYGLPADDLTG
jgi:uncharacterized protein (TIGR03083 family)